VEAAFESMANPVAAITPPRPTPPLFADLTTVKEKFGPDYVGAVAQNTVSVQARPNDRITQSMNTRTRGESWRLRG